MHPIFKTYIPEGFGTVNGYIFSDNAPELIDFLKNAFYAEVLNLSINEKNGDIANCILKIGSSCFMISQARGEYLHMRTAFYLYVNDVPSMHNRALSLGAKEQFAPAEMPYKDLQSGIVDPSGNYWWISERLEKTEY